MPRAALAYGSGVALLLGCAVADGARSIERGYALVHGLRMYYEVHGRGAPLVLLHGALGTIETSFGDLLPLLARTRTVVAVEQQGHGRTGDVDRPLDYEQMADDTAALLGHLDIGRADFFGYSMGGGVAVQIAMRHPALVRRLCIAGAAIASDGVHSELAAAIEALTVEQLAGSALERGYHRSAPRPAAWSTLIEKVKQLDRTAFDWAERFHAIDAPVLIVVGDADIVRPEHAVEMLRMLGGGVAGDLQPMPRARLAILPGTTHVSLLARTAWPHEILEASLPADRAPECDRAQARARAASRHAPPGSARRARASTVRQFSLAR